MIPIKKRTFRNARVIRKRYRVTDDSHATGSHAAVPAPRSEVRRPDPRRTTTRVRWHTRLHTRTPRLDTGPSCEMSGDDVRDRRELCHLNDARDRRDTGVRRAAVHTPRP